MDKVGELYYFVYYFFYEIVSKSIFYEKNKKIKKNS